MNQIQSKSIKATVEQLVQTWVAAQLADDAGALEQMVTDDFTVIGPRGFILGKREWLAGYKSGDLKFESLDWSEAKVRTYGDSAIVTGRDKQRVSYQGQPQAMDLRATLVFVRQRDEWRLAAAQFSPIAGPP
jgi:uncharacterized protein (TIGR02246 family)